ncbi:MAG: hypothetical protein ACREC8_01505 [Limisphaerales bacterium]
MPIRINLLAEAKAAENLRRRDPVKRFIYGGALLVALTLAASSWLQLKVMLANKDFEQVKAQITKRSNGSQRVQSEQKEIGVAKMKLAALQKLTASRFLDGNLLNALQLSTVDGVALTRLRVQQSYQLSKETGSKSSKFKKPATVTENIVVVLDAQDSSANPGDRVNKFKDAIANQSYFKTMLNPTNGVLLTSLSAPQSAPDGRTVVSFTIECHYPEYTRR